jgi:prepilin-type N-terminal cleavage/methylation domain-containing protein
MKTSPAHINHLHGFTLLEMLFAVVIFSFALVSLMTIAGKGVIATSSARDQLAAEFLAEEGLEVVRNVRDSNYVNSVPWNDGAIAVCMNGNPCDVDYSNPKPTLVQCDGGCQGNILFNNQGTFRPNATGDATTFWREITITDVAGGDTPQEILVQSTVHWKQKALNRSFTVQTYLSDWRQ